MNLFGPGSLSVASLPAGRELRQPVPAALASPVSLSQQARPGPIHQFSKTNEEKKFPSASAPNIFFLVSSLCLYAANMAGENLKPCRNFIL